MLAPRERTGIREFWFTTNTSANKVRCFRENPKASIYFVDRRFFRGVCLTGTVEVLESREAKERIWRDGDTVYYPDGVDVYKRQLIYRIAVFAPLFCLVKG